MTPRSVLNASLIKVAVTPSIRLLSAPHMAALGGSIGGLAGGGLGALTGLIGKKEDRKKKVISRAVTGALLGGGTGAALGAGGAEYLGHNLATSYTDDMVERAGDDPLRFSERVGGAYKEIRGLLRDAKLPLNLSPIAAEALNPGLDRRLSELTE